MVKKYVLIGLLLLFVIITGCKSQSTNQTGEVIVELSGGERDQALMQEAIESLDGSLCLDVSSRVVRNMCYNEVAIAKKDISVCKLLVDNNSISGCIKKLVLELKDAQDCNDIGPDWKELCYKEVAVATENIVLCTPITDQEMKDGCVKGVAETIGSVEFCGEISDKTLKDKCIASIALDKNNPETCKLLSEPLMKATCYQVVASKLKDVAICERIFLSDIRADCYSSVNT